MRWTLRSANALLVCLVCACSTVQTVSSTTTLCNTVANSLTVLASARAAGRLSPQDVAAVQSAVILTDPICQASVPPADATAAMQALLQGMTTLSVMAQTKGAL